MSNKYKVFMPAGTIQTVIAESFNIEWATDGATGRLRFYVGQTLIAAFPPGGWHGIQNMESYKKEVV